MLTHHLIEDLLTQTRININKEKPQSTEDIRNLGYQIVNFTPEVVDLVSTIKSFLFKNVYKHHLLMMMNARCQKIVKGLFKAYMQDQELLPLHWQELFQGATNEIKADIIADYIAGMTDRFAIKQYEMLYDLNFDKI